jgi:probable F420-dependent oxidoreductase
MKIGVVYPQTEYGDDPAAIRDYAQTAEGLGYTHILAFDHVLGANPDRPGGWKGAYTYESAFQEPFVLFAVMAGLTQTIEFAPGVIILPQRQTALFAKQAASLDVLSGGRLRLGVGLGWNPVEYTALNENFRSRSRRIEEQVEVLRLLWTRPLIEFKGRWHTIPDAGINPLPVQRPIPLWFGGTAEPALKRAARLADGWMTNYRRAAEARPGLELIAQGLADAGRDPATFGLEARVPYGDGNPETLQAIAREWEAAGATHISVNTMSSGLDSPQKHLEAIQRFMEAAGGR